MKLDEGKIVSTAKYYIDEFCSFMYFLWCCDDEQPSGRLLAIGIAAVVFLIAPAILILLLQGVWEVLTAIFTNPLATLRVVVTVSLILALPISGLVLCCKRGKKLEDADEDDDDEIC